MVFEVWNEQGSGQEKNVRRSLFYMLEGFLFKHNLKKKRELQRANPRVGWLALAAPHRTIRVMKLMRAGTTKPALKRAGAAKSQHK